MAAYAALTSLKHIIHQLQNHHFPPISLHKQVESLTQIVTFHQEFLEGSNYHVGHSDEADPLEMRIADAAYKAEDVMWIKSIFSPRFEGRNDAMMRNTAVQPQLQRNVSKAPIYDESLKHQIKQLYSFLLDKLSKNFS